MSRHPPHLRPQLWLTARRSLARSAQKLLLAFTVAALGYLALPHKDSTFSSSPIANDSRGDATTGTVVSTIDGDTLVVRIGPQTQRVRLIGIDTPESRPNDKLTRDARGSRRSEQEIMALGQKATDFTRSIAPPGTQVRITFDHRRTDSYGRLLGYVFLPDGTMVNELIVASGFAFARSYPPNISYTTQLQQAERTAKAPGKGLWRRAK